MISQFDVGCGFAVAAFVVVTYDWGLTFAQEVELVWRQHWSLMTVLYLGVRYLGIVYAALTILCWIVYVLWNWTGVVAFAILCGELGTCETSVISTETQQVIIVTRLHAMYQRSRKILLFLVVNILVVNIFDGVIAVIAMVHASGEEVIFSGSHQCWITFTGDFSLLNSVTWILATVWEVFALCLAVWIAVKHFRELRRHSAGGIMGHCFTVLMKAHVLYFASFVAVSCFVLILDFSPTFSTFQNSLGIQTFYGLLQILQTMQLFVLGPRLILSVREYGAKLVADPDTYIGMHTIAFQERGDISTGSSV
ncbi:hypothetical protein BDR06DRAFT_1013018 [Suillus hirtellus]|nr:hypothetical protein BDR06DRAFT_1013018 [Suillus hirtellus]